LTTPKRKRLIVFDIEGVLLPKRRYLLFEAARKLGPLGFLKILLLGTLYETGLLSLCTTLKKIFKLLKGLKTDDLFQLYKKVPLMPSVKELFKKLKEAGHTTALISSGLPTPFIEDLATTLKADYAFGLELETVNGRLTGEISGDVIKPDGKALVLKKILQDTNLSPKDCILIVDDRNNLPMFPLSAIKIGYNPDFLVSAKSDYVIKGDLTETLPILTEETPKKPRSTLSKNEILREAIHIGSFSIPFVCIHLLNSHIVSFIILLITVLYIISELLRIRGINLPITSTITWKTAIKPELYEVATAPVFFALGIIFSLILFPTPTNYVLVAILTLGDGFATVFGKTLGRTVLPLNKGKTVEGSVFGFIFAFSGALLFVNNPIKALIGSAIGILVELLPLPIDDNLTIPLVAGLALILVP
jgi:HAD superfamily phosphoserine phosphatase-like hydrolase